MTPFLRWLCRAPVVKWIWREKQPLLTMLYLWALWRFLRLVAHAWSSIL